MTDGCRDGCSQNMCISIEIVEFTMSLKPRHSLHMDWTGTAAVQLGGGAWEFQDAELAAVARAAKCR